MRSAPFALAAAVVLAGCGTREPQIDFASSALQRNLSPSVPAADLAELVAGNTAFGLSLFGQTRGEGNSMISPYSVSLALAMAWAGARGQTEAEMASALHLTLPQERLHPAFDALDLALASRGQGARGKDGNPFRLRIANAAFAQKGFPVGQPFLDTLAVHYGAGVGLLDFFGAPEPSRLAINDWVAFHTEDRIKDLLPQGSIAPSTRLVLVNAVYFNAAWKTAFEPARTSSEPFRRLDGSAVDVATMHVEAPLRALQNQAMTAVELPYDGDEIAMLVMAPAAGSFQAFEDSLSPAALADVDAHLQVGGVALAMPKFGFEAAFGLVPALSQLGMPSAFSEAADFRGISEAERLQISDVVHQTFVAVDESGTEAAAATGVIVGTTSALQTQPIAIDRPFLFFIRDVATGTVLFAGRVVDPR